MGFTRAYKPGVNIILLLLLFLIFFLRLSDSDKPTMSAFLAVVTPTPFGWSSATHFCNWPGVKCDNKNRVISVNLASLSLSGTLPPSLNSLTFLTTLSLQHNHFSGQLPSLVNLSRLLHLHLHNNSFSTIQPRTFSGLTALRTLSLSNNNLFPWVFPSELTTSPQLTALYASNANMIGSIPDIFNSFPHLVNLTLSHNNLTGSLPASFNSLSSIQNLKLDNQKLGLTGNIDYLTGMTNLSVLWLHGNLFTGVIPTFFASMPNVIQLKLDRNKFLTNDIVSSNCRRCKVFIRMVVAPAPRLPPPFSEPSSEKKTNVGLVVALTILLLLMIFGLFFGVRWFSHRHSQRITTIVRQQGKQIDIPIPVVVKNPPEKIVSVSENDVQGRQLGRVQDVKKKPDQMKDLGPRGGYEGNNQGKQPRHSQIATTSNPPENIARVERKREGKERGEGQQPDPIKNVKRKPEKMEDLGRHPGKEEVPVMPRGKEYSYNDVRIMTKNFDSKNVIGEGGFALVYKGKLLNGKSVAVKRLKQMHKIVDDYKNEVEALGQTSHFNLVKLIGYCAEDEHRMLVYEYMRNGPLKDWIFGTNPEKTLSWFEKKRIILGIAKGLVYLHENCFMKIMHRDLKPPNVLLDNEKNAKLCDFGISKLLERDQSSTSTVGCGTPGYVAPEIRKGARKVSEKVDVYSFGVVVLEVLFGERYYGLLRSSDQTNLEVSQLPGLIRKLDDEMWKNAKEIEKIGKLAISCLSDEPKARPTMSDIVFAIKGADAKVGRY